MMRPLSWLRGQIGGGHKRRRHKTHKHMLRLEALEDRQLLSTFTVVNTNDSGTGSLRQAILGANAHANTLNAGNAADEIDFNIAGNSVHTIQPATALPAITDAVIINGYSQPLNDGSSNHASPNTAAIGDNAVLRIELNGN